MDHFQTTWSQPTQGEALSPGEPLGRGMPNGGLVKNKSTSLIKAQLHHLMKSQHATLERYLGPARGGDEALNGFSQKSLPLQNSLDIRDGSEIYAPGKSFEYDPRINYNMPSHQLLPSSEVDKQGIQTPLQYKAAVLAAERSNCALRQTKRLDGSQQRLGEHLAATRLAQKRGGSRKLGGSRPRQSLSKSREQLSRDGSRRHPVNPASMAKRSAERYNRRLPAYGTVKASKIVRCAKVREKKSKKMSRENSGCYPREDQLLASHGEHLAARDASTSGMRLDETLSRRLSNSRQERLLEGHLASGVDLNDRYPYSFGQTGAAHTQKGLLHESVLSPPESMGATNQYTFMQNVNNTRGPSPPFMRSDAYLMQERIPVDSAEYADGGARDGSHNISFFNSQKISGNDQFGGQGNCEVQMIVTSQYDQVSQDRKRHQSQQQNPFQSQLPSDAPVFSTVQPPSSSAMGNDQENAANSSINVEERDTERLAKEELQNEGTHRASEGVAVQSVTSNLKYKRSSVLGVGPVYEAHLEQYRASGDRKHDQIRALASRFLPEGLPTSEPDESLYQQQLTMTQGHSFDHAKSQHQASQQDHQFHPAHLFSSSQGHATKSRETNEVTLQHQPPNASTLTSVGRANQARFGSKVMHIANKYNIELNPDKQQIFDERDRQSSMITSQTAYLSRGSSPQRAATQTKHSHNGPAAQSKAGTTNFRSMAARAGATLNSSFQAGRKVTGSVCSKLRKRAAGSSSLSKHRPKSLLDGSRGRSSSKVQRGTGAEASGGRGARAQAKHQEKLDRQLSAKERAVGQSKTPKKLVSKQRAMRSGSKSNSVRRCLNAFMAGLGSKGGPANGKSSRRGQNTLNTQKSSAFRGTLSQHRFGNTTQQSTIKACVGAGSRRPTSHDRIHNQTIRQDLAQNDWQPMRLSQGVGQDSRTSLMTAITIKTQGNNQGTKHVSNRKKTRTKLEGARARRHSAAQPANHKKMGSGSLPKRFDFTGGYKTRVPSRYCSHSSRSRSKHRHSGANSRSKRKQRKSIASNNRSTIKRTSIQKSFKQDLQMADLYHREAMIRKFFCNWIERFIDRLRRREEKEMQRRMGHSAPSLPEPMPIVSTRAALDRAITRTHTDSRMSLPTNSAYEPGPAQAYRHHQQTPQYKFKDHEQLNGGTAIAKFYSQQLVSEDSQKSPANHISHRQASHWRSKAHRKQNSTLSGDRSSMSVTKSRKSRKSKSSISDHSKRSRLSRSRRKDGRSKGMRNLTATNEQILFMDASKSSVPISQSFFDNVASPCSYSAMLQQKARKQWPGCKLHRHLDRQQSFSAEQVGDNRAHNRVVSGMAEAYDCMERDDVIEQLNGGGQRYHQRDGDPYGMEGPVIKLKNKFASGKEQRNDSKQKKERREQRVANFRFQQGLDGDEELSRNWFDRLHRAQRKRKSPLQEIPDSGEPYQDEQELQNMRDASQDSPTQELRETAQLGQQMRRNEDLIFPLELSEAMPMQDQRSSSPPYRARSGKSRRTHRGSQHRVAQDEGHRKSRLRRGLKILKKYQSRVLGGQYGPREQGRSAKKTTATVSRTSKQCSNSKSRGGKSRSLSKEHSHRRRIKEAPSRVSTINHTNASYMPQNSITISDHVPEQKSQKGHSRSQLKKSNELSGTPPRLRRHGADVHSLKSQASASAKSKSLCSQRKRRSKDHPQTLQKSDTLQAPRTLSRSHQSQTISRHKHTQPAYLSKTGNTEKRSTLRLTITVEDIDRLRMHKYFLKWVGRVRRMGEHSKTRTRSGQKSRFRRQGSSKKSASRHQSHRQYPESHRKKSRAHDRSGIATHGWADTLNSRSGPQRHTDPRKAMAKEYRRNNLKMRALRILYRHAFNSHKLVVLREHLRHQTRANLVTRMFARWIEAYSEQMKQRARQEWLLKKREDNCMARAFQGWQRLVESRKAYRDRVRSVVPMRCLLRMIGQQAHVPSEALDERQYLGQELEICAQYYEMRHVDEQVMYDSLAQFQSNLIAAVFQALKPDHLKHPARNLVRARHRLLALKRCWDGVLGYTQEQRVLRVKYKHLSMIHQARVKSEMLQTWLQTLSEKNSMLRKALKAGQHFRPRCARKYFGQLRAYTIYRRAKVQKSNYYRMTYQEKIKRLAFAELYSVTMRLRDLGEKFNQVHAVSSEYRRRAALIGWAEVTAKTTKARLLYEWNLKVRCFALQREATIVSQIDNEKKQRVHNYIVEKARRQVIWFLREYCVERRADHGVKEQNKLEAGRHRLRRLFLHLHAQCVQKKKMKQISELLQGEFRAKRLQQCWDQLQQNVLDQQELRDREYNHQLRFKASMFAHLRQAARKQQMLRSALIETVQKRNRARADFVLSNWRRLAFQKQVSKLDLQERIYVFTVQRTIKKLRLNQQLMIEHRRIEQLCAQQYQQHLKHLVWRTLLSRHRSPKVLNVRKAQAHRQRHLLVPCMQALARQVLLGRQRDQVHLVRLERIRAQALARWVRALHEKRQNMAALKHYHRRLRQRALAGLKKFLVSRYELESRFERACEHYEQQLLSKYFAKLQVQKSVIDALEKEKAYKVQSATRQFLSRKLHKWAIFARMNKSLRSKAAVIEHKWCKRQQRKYLSKMLELYAYKTNLRLSINFRRAMVGRRVFRHLRAQAKRNKEIRDILEEHLQGKASSRMLAAFSALKEYRASRLIKGRKEAVALGQLGEFIQRKVFDILLENAVKRKRLAALSQRLQERTDELLMARCIREMVETFLVQPRLDAVADAYYRQKNLRRFKEKTDYFRERRLGGRLNELEVKAFRLLGQNLLRKSLTALKVTQQCNALKRQERLMVHQFQRRRWFGIWRQAYLVRSRANYLVPQQDGAIGTNISMQSQTPQGLRRAGRGLPPKYRQSFQQSQQASLEAQLQESYYSNPYSRLHHTTQKAAPNGFHVLSSSPACATGAQPGTPSLPPPQRLQLSAAHSAMHLASMHSEHDSVSNQREGFQSIAKKCQMLSEKVQQRLSQRSSRAAAEQREVSYGSVMAASEYGEHADNQERRMQEYGATDQGFAVDAITMGEHDAEAYGQLSREQLANPNENLGNEEAISANESPQRSPQKSQPRQRQLQQSKSPEKRQLSSKLHDTEGEYGFGHHSADLDRSAYSTTAAAKVAAQLSQPHVFQSFSNDPAAQHAPSSGRTDQSAELALKAPRTRSFKKYLEQNSSLTKFSK